MKETRSATDPRPRRLHLAALAWAVGSCLYILHFDPLSAPILTDNQHYFFIAERAASGVPPHVSFFDPKTHLSTLLSGAVIAAGRLVGIPDLDAARLLSIIMTSAAVALGFLVSSLLNRSLLAGNLTALAMLSLGGFMSMGAMGLRPKVFMVPFVLAALIAIMLRRPLAAGTAAGLAFLCWQMTAVISAGVVVGLLFDRRPYRAVALFLVGALAVGLPYVGYFAIQGAVDEMFEQSVFFPMTYMSGGFSVGKLSRTVPWFLDLPKDSVSRTVLPALLLAALAAGWLAVLARPRRSLELFRAEPVWLALLVGATLAVSLTLQDYQGFPDRFLAEPFMAIAVGTLGRFVSKASGVAGSQAVRRLVSALAIAAVVILVWRHPLPRYGKRLEAQYRLAEKVGDLAASGSTVYAIGCTHLLAFAHLDNHVPFGLGYRGVEAYLRDISPSSPWRPVRSGRMPDIVLHSRGPIPGGSHWLESEYVEVEHPEFRAERVRYYARRAGVEKRPAAELPGGWVRPRWVP